MPSRVRGKDVDRASPPPCTRNFAGPVPLDWHPLPFQRLSCSGCSQSRLFPLRPRTDIKQSFDVSNGGDV